MVESLAIKSEVGWMACLTLEYLSNQRRRFAAVRLLASRHDVVVGPHEHRQPNPFVKTARISPCGREVMHVCYGICNT